MNSKLALWGLAILTILFAILEMFLWNTGTGIWVQRSLGHQVGQTAVWAANQGVYNLFLAAGLVWAARCPDSKFSFDLGIFFLACIAIAGLYGAYTVDWKFLVAQTLPSAIAMAVILRAHSHL